MINNMREKKNKKNIGFGIDVIAFNFIVPFIFVRDLSDIFNCMTLNTISKVIGVLFLLWILLFAKNKETIVLPKQLARVFKPVYLIVVISCALYALAISSISPFGINATIYCMYATGITMAVSYIAFVALQVYALHTLR